MIAKGFGVNIGPFGFGTIPHLLQPLGHVLLLSYCVLHFVFQFRVATKRFAASINGVVPMIDAAKIE